MRIFWLAASAGLFWLVRVLVGVCQELQNANDFADCYIFGWPDEREQLGDEVNSEFFPVVPLPRGATDCQPASSRG